MQYIASFTHSQPFLLWANHKRYQSFYAKKYCIYKLLDIRFRLLYAEKGLKFHSVFKLQKKIFHQINLSRYHFERNLCLCTRLKQAYKYATQLIVFEALLVRALIPLTLIFFLSLIYASSKQCKKKLQGARGGGGSNINEIYSDQGRSPPPPPPICLCMII